MTANAKRVKRRVWFGLLFVLTGTAVWWFWTRAQPHVAETVAVSPQPFVRLAGAGANTGDRVLRERAEYFDPTPLFFPTEWNYGQGVIRESLQRQPGQVFGSFEPKLPLSENNIKPFSADTVVAPEHLADVLEPGNEAPFGGMGQIDVPHPALDQRTCFLEIKRLNTGESIIQQSLVGISPPYADFDPLEFLVVVSSLGIVGEPVLLTGSTRAEMDAFFRSYLVKTFRLGERLNPGRYRVLIGP
jgi:hypothetical protein